MIPILSVFDFAVDDNHFTQRQIGERHAAENGDIVVALVEDSATVKRFFKENGHYRLQPENDAMQPIIVDQVEIQGKVIGLLRSF